jgi:glycerophosphoryl diester phosphodiesterase
MIRALVALLLIPPIPLAAHDLPACPVLISHAGARALAPENTVPGINAARDVYDVDMVEGDVRYNRSNFAFLLHNDDVAPTTTGTGSITNLWLGQLQAVSAADYDAWPASVYGGFKPDDSPKVRPPYSYDFLSAVKTKDLTFVADAKVTPTQVQADSLMEYVNRPEFALAGKIKWMANSPAGLTTMRAWYPALDYWLLAINGSVPATGSIYTAEYVAALGASTVAYQADRVNPPLVAYYHAAGLKVNAWTTNTAAADSPPGWEAMRTAGVDYLTTNRSDLVKALWLGVCE